MSINAEAHLPLSALDFQVLAVLVQGPMHGYGIVQAAEQQFKDPPVLEIGSLYRIISRMLDGGLIEEVTKPEGVPASGRKRRFYCATNLGRAVLRAEAARVRSLLAVTDSLNLEEAPR